VHSNSLGSQTLLDRTSKSHRVVFATSYIPIVVTNQSHNSAPQPGTDCNASFISQHPRPPSLPQSSELALLPWTRLAADQVCRKESETSPAILLFAPLVIFAPGLAHALVVFRTRCIQASPHPLFSPTDDTYQARYIASVYPHTGLIHFSGGTYHYGLRIDPLPSVRLAKDAQLSSYEACQMNIQISCVTHMSQIWRTWGDCLYLQEILEVEYTTLLKGQQSERMKQLAVDQQSESDLLVSTHKPDVHVYLPKLSKTGTIFKPSAATVARRSAEYHAFVDALLGDILPPVLRKIRNDRIVHDFFGYWRRDDDLARKAGRRVSMPTSTYMSTPEPATSLVVYRTELPQLWHLQHSTSQELVENPLDFSPIESWELMSRLSTVLDKLPHSYFGPEDDESTCATHPSEPSTLDLHHSPTVPSFTIVNASHPPVVGGISCDHGRSAYSTIDSSSTSSLLSQPSPTRRLPPRRPPPTSPPPPPPKLPTKMRYKLSPNDIKPALHLSAEPSADALIHALAFPQSFSGNDSGTRKDYETLPPYDQTNNHQLTMRGPALTVPVWASVAPLVPRRPSHA
jgi:hypothetical protein